MSTDMNRRLTTTFWCLIVCAVAVWLFADTFHKYLGDNADRNEIRFAYWGGYQDHRIWSEVIDAFCRREPDVAIKPEWLPLSGYLTKIDQQLVAGAAPDVMMFQDEPFPRYSAEHFVDLGMLNEDDADFASQLADCWPTAIESFRDGDVLRGMPIHGGNVLVYCNPDAFERGNDGRDLRTRSG